MQAAPTTLRMLPLVAESDEDSARTLRLGPLPAAPPAEPAWISEAFRNVLGELRLYFATVWAFTVRPQASAEAWAGGTFKALNPIAYLVNGLAIIGPWRFLWE